MAMQLMTPAQFASELEQRGCRQVSKLTDGTAIWEDDKGEPFSLPPPEENGRYPDWMLDDLIAEVGLCAEKPPHH